MQNAAAYIRVSTDDQLEYSPDSQLDRIREYANTHDLFLPEEYIFRETEGISGRKAEKRPAFLRMIVAAKQKSVTFRAILVWKFSRFARNREDSIVYKSMLRRQCGIDVISVSEPVGDDKLSVLIEAMIEAMDEYYSINLGEEARRGMKKKFETGGIITGAPFGYRVENGCYVIDATEAAIVREMFSSFLSGQSYREIAQWLNARALLTKRQNKWENRTVEYVLRNPVYTGSLRFSQTEHPPHSKDTESFCIVSGNHPPIISKELFDRAQLRVYWLKQQYPHRLREHAKYESMLHGLLKCGNCQKTLSAHTCGNTLAVQCIGYTHGTCNVSHHIALSILELAVLAAWGAFFASSSISFTLKRRQSPEYTSLQLKIARCEEMIRRAKEAYIAGTDTLCEYQQTKAALSIELKTLRAALHRQNAPYTDDAAAGTLSLPRIMEAVNSPHIQNVLLRAVCASIIFHRTAHTVEIRFRHLLQSGPPN